jgi:hypothetical protein
MGCGCAKRRELMRQQAALAGVSIHKAIATGRQYFAHALAAHPRNSAAQPPPLLKREPKP